MKHIKAFIVAVVLALSMGMLALPTLAHADPKSVVCQTLDSGSGCTAQSSNGVDLNKVVAAVINILSVLVGIAAVIMIMVSGFRYVTSGGDSSKIASAKSTLIYAVIGLVIVAMAQIIVKYVLDRLDSTGSKKGMIVTTHNYAAGVKRYTLNY